MARLIIKTDNRWKNFKYAYEVPKRVLKRQFDWMDDPDDGTFLKYKNHWYSLSDFMRIDPGAYFAAPPRELSQWDGSVADGRLSGVLIKISPDGEQYKIGTYRS